MHSAFLDIQLSTRVVFFSLFLILLASLAPSWNALIIDYEKSALFVPHITKFFLLLLGLFVVISFICLKLSLIDNRKRRSLIFLVNLSLFVWFFVVVYNWNAAIPVWDESSPFFIPHITKIYLTTLLILSFIVI